MKQTILLRSCCAALLVTLALANAATDAQQQPEAADWTTASSPQRKALATVKPPTKAPTKAPVRPPTKAPVRPPTKPPTKRPTKAPARPPTKRPTKAPVRPPTKGPTKAPVPFRVVPSICQVDFLVNLMDMAVGLNKAIAPQWLRLSFHDAGTFDRRVPEGGANGCLLTNADMRLQPENHNLDLAIETLLVIREQMMNDSPDPIRLNAADLIQFAGFFVSVRQRGTFPGLTTAKRTELQTSFQWGRPDELNCQTRWTTNLPTFKLGTDPLDIPLRCLFAGKEVKDRMMDRNGFTAREATALIGAHTIGKTRNVFGPNLAAPWVTNGADAATAQGPVFDNAYHKFLIGATPTSTVDGFSRSRVPFDRDFPDWFRASTPALNHLDTDIVLAYPSQNLTVHPHYDTFSKEFAASNTEFINAFKLALNKMSKLGVKVTLQSPVACGASWEPYVGPVAPSQEYTGLLLAAVAEAEDDLDATLLAQHAEITFQTTPVVGAGP